MLNLFKYTFIFYFLIILSIPLDALAPGSSANSKQVVAELNKSEILRRLESDHAKFIYNFFAGDVKIKPNNDSIEKTFTELIDHFTQEMDENARNPNQGIETWHSFIQKLFPLPGHQQDIHENFKSSDRLNLNKSSLKLLSSLSVVKKGMKQAYTVYMRYLGLEYREETLGLQRMDGKKGLLDQWITDGGYNHNFARISRVLASLTLFGLESESDALMNHLIASVNMKSRSRDYKDSMEYWKSAYENGRKVKGLFVKGVLANPLQVTLRMSNEGGDPVKLADLPVTMSSIESMMKFVARSGRNVKEIAITSNKYEKKITYANDKQGLQDLGSYLDEGDKLLHTIDIRMLGKSPIDQLALSLKNA